MLVVDASVLAPVLVDTGSDGQRVSDRLGSASVFIAYLDGEGEHHRPV